ncbi:MAG TPA: serpin family protein [Kofleriaceae bacterium]|nr:serpin family protein [Kofleriaceae bacterium]
MRTLYLVIAVAGCSQPNILAERQLPEAERADAATVTAANNQFACDVLGKLPAGNAFFSPFSMSTALAMLDAGAAGNTDVQLRNALHYTLSGDPLQAAYGALIKSIDTGRSYGGYTLATADRLFGQKGFAFEPSYLDVTRTDYGAQLMPLDFADDPDGSRTTINHWVASQTDDKIPELFPEGTIQPDTTLVLANAILFKGTWDAQFDTHDTQMRSFHVAGAADVTAPIMSRTGTVALATIPGGTLGILPFRGKDLAMVILLPSDPDGLPALEAQLTGPALAQWIASAVPSDDVDVSLPRFTLTESFGFNQMLQSFGVTDAFDASLADFSGIDGQRDLFVQSTVHQATVTVDEEGAEAAAATGISVGDGAAYNPLDATHSFAFLIYDQVTGSVLFLGRLVDPTAP